MFRFYFKRKEKTQLSQLEKDLLLKTLKLLGSDYSIFEEQIESGIIDSVGENKVNPDFKRFRLNVKLLNKFENKKGRCFFLNNVNVFDNTSNKYISFSLDFGFGLVFGSSIQELSNMNLDLNKINIDSVYKTYYGEDDFNKIKFLFSKEELACINNSDVYELELGGKIYYHLKDIGDGDFLGIDIHKNIYKITHDPFEINIQTNELVDILK